jgi:hypothetical protein
MAGGGFGVAALPGGMYNVPGMYIIINCNPPTENRYVGISTDIGDRFRTRMATVTELDIDAATLANIHVVWGRVKFRNHPPPGAPAPGPPGWSVTNRVGGGTVLVPTWSDAGWTHAVPPAGHAPFVRTIDGRLVNLEHILVRFVMTQLLAGGTVSNNQLMYPFTNPAGHGVRPVVVKFYSAAFAHYNAYTIAAVLNPGGAAW